MENTNNEDIANMKLKHPYMATWMLNSGYNTYLSFRKLISDNKLSFMFNRHDVTSDTEGWDTEDGYIYFKPFLANRNMIIWHELDGDFNGQENIENTLVTVWIFEGRTSGENGIESYTKIKGYRKKKTCSCFMAIEIESQTQQNIPIEI